MFDSPVVDNAKVNLKDVAIIKVVCDTFFLHQIRPAVLQLQAIENQGSIRGSLILNAQAGRGLKKPGVAPASRVQPSTVLFAASLPA
jgi:hypothetical protein